MYENFISSNDSRFFGQNDSETIQNAINFAEENQIEGVIIPRKNVRTNLPIWDISKTVLLPSNITVILDNCHLRLSDNVYCNMFRNKNAYNDNFCTLKGEQENIRIIGVGYAVLDGGKTNYVFETNYLTALKTNPLLINEPKIQGIRFNNLILLHNVKNFSLENFEVRNQRWWAINLIYCEQGNILDITSRAFNNIPNQDCIDIRQGCNNINIERIMGQSGDDLIAITALDSTDSNFAVVGKSPNVHDINIKDVVGTSVRQGVVVLRNQDFVNIYNVSINNVIQSDLMDKNNMPYVTVRVGENGYYKNYESQLGSTRNITVKNVIAQNESVVTVGATLKDCSFKNICAVGSKYSFMSYGVKMKDVKIDGVYYTQPYSKKQSPAGGFLEDNHFAINAYMREDDFTDNVIIDRAIDQTSNQKPQLNKDIKNDIIFNGEKL